MNKQELAIARRVKLLETLQNNPSLRLYMTDLLEEIKNPESLFNARWTHHSGQVDRITVLRLCDAFSVAKKHEERYHLDLLELIEFVSEKTVQILEKDKDIPAEQFKVQIRNFIHQEFPFRNALLKRSARQNMLSYSLYDKNNIKGMIDENGHYYEGYQGETPEIDENILFTSCANIMSSNLEDEYEERDLKEVLGRALERLPALEKEVVILHFGLRNGQQRSLAEIGIDLRKSKLDIKRIEQSAFEQIKTYIQNASLYALLEKKQTQKIFKKKVLCIRKRCSCGRIFAVKIPEKTHVMAVCLNCRSTYWIDATSCIKI